MARRKFRFVPLVLLLIGFAVLLWLLTRGHTVAILQPHGEIAARQKSILAFAFFLSMVVIIPVYILTILISVRYRADNKKAKYSPEWDHSRRLETVWWGIPFVIILILSVVTWQTSHSLDPFKPLSSDRPPIHIQVVALQWKWLFIYPDQHIATVNYFKVPAGTPINFSITADAPMNSFWIPQLGGQIYAMPGMSTQLHLIADTPGTYQGSSANISGSGFASMHFTAEAVPTGTFNQWVAATSKKPEALNTQTYAMLADPHTAGARSEYGHVQEGMYDSIVMQYMSPGGHNSLQANNTITNGEPVHAW